jgi:hypothetical protein
MSASASTRPQTEERGNEERRETHLAIHHRVLRTSNKDETLNLDEVGQLGRVELAHGDGVGFLVVRGDELSEVGDEGEVGGCF